MGKNQCKLKSEGIERLEGKLHPRTDHDGPEGEQMYSSTFPSTSALDGGWVVNATPRAAVPTGKTR